jgi:hypothetical protein
VFNASLGERQSSTIVGAGILLSSRRCRHRQSGAGNCFGTNETPRAYGQHCRSGGADRIYAPISVARRTWPMAFEPTVRLQLMFWAIVAVNVLCILYMGRKGFGQRCREHRKWIREYKMTRTDIPYRPVQSDRPDRPQKPAPELITELVKGGHHTSEIIQKLFEGGISPTDAEDLVSTTVEKMSQSEQLSGRKNMLFGAAIFAFGFLSSIIPYPPPKSPHTDTFVWIIMIWGGLQFVKGFAQRRRGRLWIDSTWSPS